MQMYVPNKTASEIQARIFIVSALTGLTPPLMGHYTHESFYFIDHLSG
jgi:hypothetical protein